VTYLDTHSAIWLRKGDRSSLSKRAAHRVDAEEELLISPIILLELEQLYEIGRLKVSADQLVADLANYAGVRICTYPFGLVMDQALREKWTRDPFDRIIVAHARAREAALVTSDEKILRHYELAVW
jgi:PIN domain nuclease of toxin-antitoxin system